jgi:peroxiredoxin Q/BCP
MRFYCQATVFLASVFISALVQAAGDLKVSDPAPVFQAQTHEGKDFDLTSRKGQWTVLYFYPKAATPGCTKQACAFRDNIDQIRVLGADVIGISADSVEAQQSFHKEQKLNFTLLADPDGKIVRLYGAKMMGLNMSKRWTFILDPELRVRDIEKDVDPILNAQKMAQKISGLQGKK